MKALNLAASSNYKSFSNFWFQLFHENTEILKRISLENFVTFKSNIILQWHSKGGRRSWAHQHSLHSFEKAFLSRNLNQIMPKNALFLGKKSCKNRRSVREKGENP